MTTTNTTSARLTVIAGDMVGRRMTTYGTAHVGADGVAVVEGFPNLTAGLPIGVFNDGQFKVGSHDGELFLQALAWFYRAAWRVPTRFEAVGFTVDDDATLRRRLLNRLGKTP